MGVPAASSPSLRSLPLVWHGSLRDPSGYADEARAYLLALDRAGYNVGAREIRYTDLEVGLSGAQLEVIERAAARREPDGDFVLVHHVVPASWQPLHERGPDVARTMFETESIPRMWVGRLLAVDEVWVPCEFNRESFQRGGVPGERIRVLPETIDFDLFDSESVEPLELPQRRGFVFLANFDFTDRKGWDVLLDAWADAFGPDDDVCLVLKCLGMNGAGGEEEIRARIDAYLGGRRTAPLVVDGRILAAADMPRLYAAADAFVLPSRGEGWGRPYMEAMAMGLPAIGSRWSGNLSFMHDGNSWLLDGLVVAVPSSAQGHTPLYRGQRWFEPDRDALVAALREVAAAGVEARARAAGARTELLQRFGPEVVAERIAHLTGAALERWRWRSSRPVACVWRGGWGSSHSLAVVNDGVVGALEEDGQIVVRAAPGQACASLDLVGVAQQWPPSFDAPAQGPFVLYQPWEFGRVPVSWVEAIREHVDEVWTPSESAREAFVASGLAPDLVHVVPNGVDLEHFTPEGPARPFPRRAGTVFLSVGGTLDRKGVDVLLDAYGRAFRDGDDVLLVIKSFRSQTLYHGVISEPEIENFRSRPGAPDVLLLDDDVPYADMPALYRTADAVVQPYRAEGFCLPALEALACGRPILVTAGGPTDEFASDDCSWRIASRRVSLPAGWLPPDLLPLAGEGWALEPDVEALARALREATDPAARAERAAHARAHAERYSWVHAAAAARSRLEALRGRTPIRRVAPASVPGRRGLLLLALAEWERRETWAPALVAYARAFGPEDDTTLVLPAGGPDAPALVEEALQAAGLDPARLADVVLADGVVDAAALELAADAVVCSNGCRPARARRILPAEPGALRAFVRTR